MQSLVVAGFDKNILDINQVTHIKIIDVIGDGSSLDTLTTPIYDPYPTYSSSGFDLDAIGVINQSQVLQVENIPIPMVSTIFLSLLLIFIRLKN